MARLFRGLCVLAAFLSWAKTGVAQDETGLIRSSQFIFVGTVQQLHASNVKLLAASDQTSLVRVDSMLRAPRGMSFSGRSVTISWPAASRLKLGERVIFFANGWLYGENMAMRAVGELPAGVGEGLRSEIAKVDAQTADDALLVRLREADLVIVGKVLTISMARKEEPQRSEHETGWALAEIAPAGVIKGRTEPGKKTVRVYFPTSTDELWYLSPKLSASEEGVFILSARAAKRYGLEGYTALDRLDVRPLEERVRVESLLRTLR